MVIKKVKNVINKINIFFRSVEYWDCADAYEKGRRNSGLYFLKDKLEWHYCNMEILGACGSGGWTLAMLANGNQV